jgi:hypothetical protein
MKEREKERRRERDLDEEMEKRGREAETIGEREDKMQKESKMFMREGLRGGKRKRQKGL